MSNKKTIIKKKPEEDLLIDDYLKYHNEYVKKYGAEKTLVLMQVGSFYEAYATDKNGPPIQIISDLINIVCTRKDKTIMEISRKNPYMMGFPMVSTEKHVSLLINNGYTVIIIDQVTPKPNIVRKVVGVYSPGTYVGDTVTQDTNYTACIYIQNAKQLNKQHLLVIGMSAIDVSTGRVIVHEGHSTLSDNEIGLDETQRFLNSVQPKEIVFIFDNENDIKTIKKNIFEYLQVNEEISRVKTLDSKYTKIAYQNEFLNTIYEDKKSMLSQLENLELDRLQYATISLLTLIDFLIEHNNNLVNKLNTPVFFMDRSHIVLGNNAIYQLNIVESDAYNYSSKTKFKSLYDVVNNASTSMGKRFVKNMLLSPLINSSEIETIYDCTDRMVKDGLYLKCELILSRINDIEKLKRKMALKLLQPYELGNFISSMEAIIDLHGSINFDSFKKILLDKKTLDDVKQFCKETEKIFDYNQLKVNLIQSMKTPIFKKGLFKDIDALLENNEKNKDVLSSIIDEFLKLLKIEKTNRFNKSVISIKSTKTEGNYIYTTSKRFEQLKKLLDKKPIIVNNKEIKLTDLKCIDLKNNVKIFYDTKVTIQNKTNISNLTNEEQISILTLKYYYVELEKMNEKYHKLFDILIKFVTLIDYYKSCAKTAKLYNYVRPIIKKNQFGYIKADEIRHPVVERIIDYEYVPHSVELGNKLKGMLIYGLNSSGKSVLMKAIGISVIMAQCGMFVPCKNFEFTPYKSLYTRITGNDNIFRGLSSFALEMVELNAILKRADAHALIIGDEVCRGTEHISGNSIVAGTLVNLAKKNASFVFATHLHELTKLKCMTELTNVKSYHLSVDYDKKTNTLTYDRKLKEGSGESIYGIIVASYIIQDKEFIDLVNTVKNELTYTNPSLISGKTSNYNSKMYMHKCEMCGKKEMCGEFKPLETHHINFQKDCVDGFVKTKPHIKKNDMANLMVICEKCHDKLHNDEFKIEGTVMTSMGRKIKKSV